jgi:hypothetical protein
MLGAPRETASPKDSTLIIIDAQNEYARPIAFREIRNDCMLIPSNPDTHKDT